LNRRDLLKISSGIIPFLTNISFSSIDDFFYNELPNGNVQLKKYSIKPRGLIPNKSRIAITATSSPLSTYEMRESLRFLKSEGFKYDIGKTILNQNNSRYLSASDDERADEFMKFVRDDSIDCILCGRGGYGVLRILEKLDFSEIRKNPKIIVGFSDVTALINPIYDMTGINTFHGPVAVSTFNKFTTDHFKKVLYSNNSFEPIKTEYEKAIEIKPGKTTGYLKGGNLRMLISTLGTVYEPDLENSILFLEDVSEPAYKVDRMLSQLIISGKLDKCNGIIFGQFNNLKQRQSFNPGLSFTILEVINQLFSSWHKPILLGMPFGHVKDKMTLPIGTRAELDTKKKKLTILESSII
jgi:muramoyltetrapeptide carboxypeptidase